MGVSQGAYGSQFKMELVTVSIASPGSVETLSGSGNFANTYSSPPAVLYSDMSQTVPYVDVMLEVFVSNVTKTGFQVRFTAAEKDNIQDVFGSGTLNARFFVVGK